MIIKKTYCDDSYIIMNLTTLIGKLIDEKDCEEFREYNEVCLIMNENIEVIEQ